MDVVRLDSSASDEAATMDAYNAIPWKFYGSITKAA